jgi:hypothetical protein
MCGWVLVEDDETGEDTLMPIADRVDANGGRS